MKSFLARMSCVLSLGLLPLQAQQVVINEIMYHPQSENPLHEYIELHNRGAAAADLSGWRFVNGVEFTLPNGSSLSAGSYLVVAADVAAFQLLYPLVNNVVGGWAGQLSNGGETIELVNALGERVDVVSYADEGDWATRTRLPDPARSLPSWEWAATHDGGGDSLELINPALDNNTGQNWAPSLPAGGTPGGPNSVRQSNIAPLILNTIHSPAVPNSTQPITITARVVDESTNAPVVTLFFRNADANTYGVLNVREEFAAEHPDAVKRLLSVYERGRVYAIEHPEELQAILVEAAKIDPAVAAKQLGERTDLSNPKIGENVRTALIEASKILEQVGILKSDVDVTTLVDSLLDTTYSAQLAQN